MTTLFHRRNPSIPRLVLLSSYWILRDKQTLSITAMSPSKWVNYTMCELHCNNVAIKVFSRSTQGKASLNWPCQQLFIDSCFKIEETSWCWENNGI